MTAVANAAAPLSFGPTSAPRYRRIPIKFSYVRDETVESLELNLLDKAMDMGIASKVLARVEQDDNRVLTEMIQLVTKYLDNKDGTPYRWEPDEMAPKKGPNDVEPVRRFRGPDGRIHVWTDESVAKFKDPAKRSSRAKWLHLMNDDDDATVDAESIQELIKYIMEVGAKRPTPASS